MDAASLLRTARTRAGLSQRALATAAGTSQSAVAAIEAGRKQPTVATLDRLLRAAGTELVPADDEQAALLRRAGTRHLDVNAFVPAADAPRVLAALPADVAVPPGTAETVAADGQVRLWWNDTPIDLFLDYAPLHAQAARTSRVVPFAGRHIRVLGPVELVLFKALFDRPKDWVDIAAVVEAGAVADAESVRRGLVELVGPDDARVERWDALLT